MNDPGLQPERTALAWQRTTASLCVASLYVIRTGWHRDFIWITGLGCAMLALCGFMIFTSAARARRILRDDARTVSIAWVAPAIVAGMIVLTGVLGLAELAPTLLAR
ncbi:MAG: DUF202 domain-containing protein [Burkholderiaceae bacterium]